MPDLIVSWSLPRAGLPDPPPAQPDSRCDFCSAQPVVWCYLAEAFLDHEVEIFYDPFWFACADCQRLIDADRIAEIADKLHVAGCPFHHQRANTEVCALADGKVAALHAEFMRRRIGPGQPLPPAPA